MTPPTQDPETEYVPAGVPFLRTVCKCVRCDRLVTAKASVARGAGQKCYEHLHGASAHARLEARGQLRLPFEARS